MLVLPYQVYWACQNFLLTTRLHKHIEKILERLKHKRTSCFNGLCNNGYRNCFSHVY